MAISKPSSMHAATRRARWARFGRLARLARMPKGAALALAWATLAAAAVPSASEAAALARGTTKKAAKAMVRRAVQGAFGADDAVRVRVTKVKAPVVHGCRFTKASLVSTPRHSGRVGVRLLGERGLGTRCQGLGTAYVTLERRVWVTAHPVSAERSLKGRVKAAYVAMRPGMQPADGDPAGWVSMRALKKGAVVQNRDIRARGPRPGDPIRVRMVRGGLAIEQRGRAARCTGAQACADLTTGKRVFGAYDGAVLVVRLP